MQTLFAKNIPLRTATIDDFNSAGRRNIGMNYFLLNSNNRIETYVVTSNTDGEQLKRFIAAQRCFVFATVSDVDFDTELIEAEKKL